MVRRLKKSAITAAVVTLCLLVAAVLMFAFIPTTRKAYAENEPSVWDGSLVAAGWGSTETNKPAAPAEYVINTDAKTLKIGSAAAFAYFAHEVFIDNTAHSLDGYTVTLTVDIDLNNKTWIPIGTTQRSNKPTRRFSGTFDGNGHTISNLSSQGYYSNIKYTAADSYYVDVAGDDSIKVPFENDGGEFAFGLFGVTANMTVKNLALSNVDLDFSEVKVINGSTLIPDNVGAIIGHNSGRLTVQNCVVGQQNEDGTADSTIKIKTKGNPAIGGLVGRAYGIKQDGSSTPTTYETVVVTNSKNYIDFEYEAIANTDASSDNCGKVSGILGYSTSFKELKFEKCVNYGNINGGQIVGGIMAFFTDNSKNTVYEDADIRIGNAWNLIIDDCVNYGDITSSNLDTTTGFKTGTTHAGGIMGDLTASGDNSASKVNASHASYGKLPSINFYVRRNRNYGTIKTYNTGSANGSNRAGGIIGSFSPSETGENKIIDNYNYGVVDYINQKENISPRLGGYLGLLSFYSGGTTHGTRPIDFDLTGGSSGLVAGGAYDGTRINSLIGDRNTYPSKPCNITLVDANDYSKNISRVKEASGEVKPSTITVGATVTEIGAGEYLGQDQLTEVNFAEGSTLAKIGEWAFAGTGLTQVNLPESVTEIGEYAFGKNVLVIAADKAHYDALMASDNVADDIKNILTYVVTVEYRYFYTVLDTEYKLFNKPYGMVLGDNGKWTNQNETLGTPTTGTAVWYSETGNTPLNVSDVTELLKINAEKLGLYMYTLDKKVFYAREDIVYDGTAYSMTELNPLLQSASDRILPTMTVSIVGYVDPDGTAASNTALPTTICDAGTYTVKVVDGTEEYEFDIKIARATVDLGSYANLSWRMTAIGFSAANSELLNGNGMTLFVYTDKDGKAYPSTTILTADQITNLELKNNGAYTTKTVVYSVVRNRNDKITIEVVANDSKFTVGSYGRTNEGTNVGAYTSTVTLTATKNYRFVATAISAQRGMTVVTDGNTAIVNKTWYIVEMSNWLVSATGGDYAIRDRVYGETTAVAAPSLQYGTSDNISMSLRLNGTTIGSGFGVNDFGKYINSVMPAGSYELIVAVDGVESEEVDANATTDPDDPVMVTVYRSGFTESIVFTVSKAQLPSLTEVNAALKGKTFTYTWDGESHLYDEDAAKAVNAYLGASMPDRTGTIWAGSQYGSYYGNFAITFNLSRMQSDAYFGANDMTVAAVDPDKYTVYYRISAPNYYSSTENLAGNEVRHDYYFDVVIIREIEVPTVSNVAYTGSAVYPTITPAATGDEAFYEVMWVPDGYLSGGTSVVTFKLRNSDYYCWSGKEVGTETVSVPFSIVAADNAWLRTPNIVSWLYEEFNTEVNRIRAVPKFLDEGQSVKFTVTDAEGNSVTGLTEFVVRDDGTLSDQMLISALNGLRAGSYKLLVTIDATSNYKELTADIDFNIGKSMNAWADGDEDLVLPGWIVGNYSAKQNPIVVNPAHGEANIIITDLNGKEYYNSVTGLNKLNDCEVGKYLLKAWVDETADFAALAERTFTIEVFEKAGLPWWGTLLITLGALLVAALIIFILWKKGVFQILTGKIVLAIRNKATVDATIAAVRASKRAEEAKKTVAAAKRKELLEERRAKAAEERALPAEQRAAALEEKARKAAERAEKMKARAEAMQMRAERMKEKASEAPATEPQAEAAATEPTETPAEE